MQLERKSHINIITHIDNSRNKHIEFPDYAIIEAIVNISLYQV